MLSFRSKSFILSIFGLLLFSSSLVAQVSSSTGAIRGSVNDPSGGAVAGAKVTLSNPTLSIERTTTTSEDGAFSFPLLPPAAGYSLVIRKDGFHEEKEDKLTVRVTETTVTNGKLALGSVNQEVLVTGSAQQLNTTDATLGEVVGTRVITSLPLPTRNVFDLAATDAGVYENLDSPASTIAQGGNAVYVAGQRATNNDYRLNGVESTSVEFHSLAAGAIPIPDPDAIQEFRTQTSLYDATTAYGSGGSINLITRSGTSSYHGAAYDFIRNTILNANDYFLKYSQEHPAIGTPTNQAPVMIQNQFGGSFGGPIPKLHNTFFFVNYEGMRQKNGSTGAISGNIPVLPASRTAANLAAAFDLPVSSIDPVAVNLLNSLGPKGTYLFPSASGPVGGLGLYATSAPVILNTNQVSSRLDHDFKIASQDNHLAVAYFYQSGIFIAPGGSGAPGQAYDYPLGNKNLSLIDTHTLNASIVNEAVFGFNWVQRDIEAYGKGVELADVGMSRFNSSYFPTLPSFSFSDGSLSEFGYGGNIGRYQHTNQTSFHDTLSWLLNKHTLRLGFETIREQFNESPQASPGGALTFDPYFADALYGKAGSGAKAYDVALRDFLIGAPYTSSANGGVQRFHIRAANYSGFIQDDFRATSRLMLNLGLRYDHFGYPTETHNFLSNFDPSLLSAATLQSGGAGLQQGFLLANVGGVSASTLGTNNGSYSPRVGFAYDVFGNAKLAVHGGFGIYYQSADDEQSQIINNPPFYETANLNNYQLGTLPGTTTPGTVTGLANPFPVLPQPDAFPLFPTFQTVIGTTSTGAPRYQRDPVTGLTLGISPSINAVQRSSKDPYSENWNLTAEYGFLHNWTLALGYLGSNGVRQSAGLLLNNALFVNAANPAVRGTSTIIANSSANRESRVPIAGISSTGLTTIVNEAYSSYNALLITVTHQLTNNFLLKMAYTHSRSIDNFPASASTGSGGSGQIGNQYVLSENTGTSEQDVPNRFVTTYVWDLPGFRNHRTLDYILGHWSLSGITTYQNGLPGIVTQSVAASSLTGTSGYGLVTGTLKNSGSPQSNFVAGKVQYLNAANATTQVPLGSGESFGPTNPQGGPGNQTYTIASGGSGIPIGVETRGAFRAPFQERWDATLSKNFPLKFVGDTGNLEFRTEAFKLLNNTIFNGPNAQAGSASFGQITSTIDSTGRQLQFALKLTF
jgi:Carboxypeptidase regulatory-like domain